MLGFNSTWTKNFQIFKLDLEKAEEPEIKWPTSIRSQKKQGDSRKTSISASLALLKPLTVWSTTNCGKFIKWEEYPDHPTCLLRNLYAHQEATVRTRHVTRVYFKTGNGVRQDCILSPCLFNLYSENIMQNAGLDEGQAGIKISRRNINHLRDADDTSLMAESEQKIKSLLMRVKEKSEKVRKQRTWHPVPSFHGKQMGRQWKHW